MSRAGISRRGILKAGAGGIAALGGMGAMRASTYPARPNILLIMTDQHRADALGADGNKVIRTPNLDQLAAEGARFRRAYVSLPSCTPGRASLLTGMSPWGHGMLGYGTIAQRYRFEMPRMLREAGYYTVGVGKMHFTPQRNGHGFERLALEETWYKDRFTCDYRAWLAKEAPGVDCDASGLGYNDRRAIAWPHREEYHPTYWTAQQGIDFLNSYRGAEPFFLKVSFQRPHCPYDPPPRWMKAYEDADLPKAAVGKWAQEEYGKFTNPKPADAPRGNLDAAIVRNMRQGYYGAISFVDEQIGRVLDALRKRGAMENTLIIFCADHGEMAGDQHLWRKTYAYEGSSRIPLIIRWGSRVLQAFRGQAHGYPVELRDILPTFLHLAGVRMPDEMEGRDLLPLLGGMNSGWREYLDLEHATCYYPENCWTGLVDKRQKYVYHAYTGKEQLFDLERDPQELVDLSTDADHATDLTKWRERMVRHLALRGEEWVKGDKLVVRRKTILYGKNYPRA